MKNQAPGEDPQSTEEINYETLSREIPHQTCLRFFSGEKHNALAACLQHPLAIIQLEVRVVGIRVVGELVRLGCRVS